MEKPAVGGPQCWFPFKRAYNKRRRNWPDSFDDNLYQETNPVACVFGRKGQNAKRDDYDISLFENVGGTSSGETELVLDGKIPVPTKNTKKPMPLRNAAKPRPYMIPARTEMGPDDAIGSLPRALASIEANPLSTAFWTDEVAVNGALCLQPTANMDVRDEWRYFNPPQPDAQSISRSEKKEELKDKWFENGVSTDMVILKEVPHDSEVKCEPPRFRDDQVENSHDNDSLVEEIRTSLVDASLDASTLKKKALNQDSQNPNTLHQNESGSSPSDDLHSHANRKQSSSMLDFGIGSCGLDFSLLSDQKLLMNGFSPSQTGRKTLCRPDYQCEDYPEPAFSIEVEPLMELGGESPPSMKESSPVPDKMEEINEDMISSDAEVVQDKHVDVDLPLLSVNEGIETQDEMGDSTAVAVSVDESSSFGERDANVVERKIGNDNAPLEVRQPLQRTRSQPIIGDGGIQDDAPSSPATRESVLVSKDLHSPARNFVRKASSVSRAMSEAVLRARSKGAANSKSRENIEPPQPSNEIVSESLDQDPYLEELDRFISSIDNEGAHQPQRDPVEVLENDAGPHCTPMPRLEASSRRSRRSPADSSVPYQPRKTRSEMPPPKSLSMKGFIGRSRSGIEPKTPKSLLAFGAENEMGVARNIQPHVVEASSAFLESEHKLTERPSTPTKPSEKKFAISGVPTDIKIPRRHTSLDKHSTKTPSVIFAPARNSANSYPVGLKHSSKPKASSKRQSAGSSRRSKNRSGRNDGFESDEDSIFSDLNSFGSSSGYTRGVESEVTTFTEYQQEGIFSFLDGWIG